jgi:hypothetical protein
MDDDDFGSSPAPAPEVGGDEFDMPAPAPIDMGGMNMGGMNMGGMDMGGMDMGGMDMGGMGMSMAPAPAPPPMPMPPMGGMGGGFGAPMEMGAVAKWRVERDEKVAAKAAASREAEAAKLAEAKAALDNFYAERTSKIAKRAAENRTAEAAYAAERDSAMIANSWESVCKLVDLKEKAGAIKDTSRMRSLLTQLKHG